MYNDSNFSTVSTRPLAVLERPRKEPRRYTLAEYLRMEENSKEQHEYYDGIIIKLPMARGPHNDIVFNIGAALKQTLKATGKKYYVRGGQQAVYLPELNFSLYPDVLVISETPQYFDNNQVLQTNPILIVEVLSKSTKKYDRTSKFDEYKTLESFQEYVLIDQKNCHVETRFREEPGLWRETHVKDINGSIFFKSINCTISLSDIYENIVF
jgi:Uma2 family endonuclease